VCDVLCVWCKYGMCLWCVAVCVAVVLRVRGACGVCVVCVWFGVVCVYVCVWCVCDLGYHIK
jgi:hypothetical protein